jgi:ubiquinone/menaquinone biosynthesis C-methylase UbiE
VRALATSAGRAALLGVAALLLVGAATPTAVPERYRATSHRTFEDVEHWKSIFDDPRRDAWQRPAEVVEALALEPGMAVADLGAGTGYFTGYLSRAVGERGTVFAVETEPRMVVQLRTRAEREGGTNVVPVLASPDDPRLPAGRVDLVLIVDTFHHIDHRLAYLERLKRTLAPKGRIAIIDWVKRDIPVGPPRDHKIARKQVLAEMQGAGYELIAEPDLLRFQYFLIFRPR